MHAIKGGGRAAPVGLGSPARGGHHLHSEPLGHWDAVTILLPIHLIYCCHLSSLRRADKSAPSRPVLHGQKSLLVFCCFVSFCFFRGNREGLTKEDSPPLGAFWWLPRVCPITECLGVWWPMCPGGWHVRPCQHGTSTPAPLPGHFHPCAPSQWSPLHTQAVTATVPFSACVSLNSPRFKMEACMLSLLHRLATKMGMTPST